MNNPKIQISGRNYQRILNGESSIHGQEFDEYIRQHKKQTDEENRKIKLQKETQRIADSLRCRFHEKRESEK